MIKKNLIALICILTIPCANANHYPAAATGNNPEKTRHVPTAAQKRQVPSATQKRQAPSATQTRQVPSATQKRQVPSATQTRQVPSATQKRQVPSATQTRQVPSATQTRQVPSATQTRQVPSATQTRHAPTATQTRQVPSATQTRQAPSATQTRHAPTATQTRNTPFVHKTRRMPRAAQTGYATTTSSHSPILWQTYHGYIPQNAFDVGPDTDGKILYACRAYFKGSVQPGKTWRGYDKCNIAYGGKEYIIKRFELMLESPSVNSDWQKNLDRAPVVIGQDTNGKALYLCKSRYLGSIQPGKTWQGYNHCNISYGGREIVQNNYKVLVSGKNHHSRNNHRAGYQCIVNFGKKLCGYHCTKSGTNAACASSPAQHCIADNFGNIQCGYNCVKSPFKVACAQKRTQNCVVNTFNEVRCGHNCRIDQFNRIQCG
jgi:DM9 repeat